MLKFCFPTRLATAVFSFIIIIFPLASAAADLTQPSGRADRPVGSAEAPVTVIEYSSPTCSHCVDYRMNVAPKIEEEFVRTGKAKILFRPFARNNADLLIFLLAERHMEPKSQHIVDAFYSRHDEIVNSVDLEQTLRDIATSIGVDRTTFDAAAVDQVCLDGLSKLSAQAVDEFGVEGTPTFFVNGKKITGAPSLETMRASITSALAGE
ncbi:thioredoxin domain-containing protein [Agrobacterium tumefaciens]|uniref:DsbA family protein n=1 Tax=Agrobacterium tumefaciens TaxID=358 RepID=UPI001571B397|nr:thioredoxin domain-containing protein [Agrobacterium tumefaciens]NTE68185.1 thioredoxin domain-containing protein [Agrobacterium tumefaciens]